VPTQDKQYLVAFAQLPDAASLDRTESVIRRMSEIGLRQPGVQDAVAFPGFEHQWIQCCSERGHRLFFGLKPFDERTTRDLSGPAIAGAFKPTVQWDPRRICPCGAATARDGAWDIGGFKLYVEDRADLGYDTLFQTLQTMIARAIRRRVSRECSRRLPSTYRKLDADIDRVKSPSRRACRCKSL